MDTQPQPQKTPNPIQGNVAAISDPIQGDAPNPNKGGANGGVTLQKQVDAGMQALAATKPQNPAPATKAIAPDLGAIGGLINDANRKLIGGVFDGNKVQIVTDLNQAATQLNVAVKADPKTFMGATGVRAQIIAGQLNQATQALQGKVNANVPKLLNDISGDVVDLATGNKALEKLGVTPLPAGAKADPFQNNAAQTAFLKQFNQDANEIATQANKVAGQNMPNSDAAKSLIQQVQTFAKNADQFTNQQGGIYSGRFNNELAANGTNGVAANVIVTGIKNNDPAKVKAAAEILTANAGDLGANMTPVEGGTFAFAAANPNA